MLKKTELTQKKSLTAIYLLSLFLVVFQLAMQAGTDAAPYISYFKAPVIVLMNYLVFALLMSIVYFASSRIWAAYLSTAVPLNFALLINYYKICFRDEPFKMSDLNLGKEAINIVHNYSLAFNFRIYALTLVNVLLIVFLAVCIKKTRITIKVRMIALWSSVIVGALFFGLVFPNKAIYDKIPIEGPVYYEVSLYDCKGFTYSFLANGASSGNIYFEPDNYSDESAKEILSEYQTEKKQDKKYPNVIAIMSEAFWDPEYADNLEFYDDPLPNIKEIRKDADYGTIIVPGFAGSTVSTEFEFLTGANLSLVNKEKPSVYNTSINSAAYCLPRLFKDMGYDTLAIHPGHHWFYNRQNVYRHFGFDRFININDLPKDIEKVNYYVSDSETAELIIENYKDHIEKNNGNGYFNFVVTIQNHGPYMDYKTDRPDIYVRPDGIDDKLYNIINNYMNGLSDADAMLGRVKDFLESIDEPTVLVFFGDHLPYFDSDFKAYDILGYDINSGTPQSLINRYSIPYVIWSNDAAKDLIKSNGARIKQGKNELFSSNYLTTELLNYMGMDLPPYFAFVNEMHKSISVIESDFYIEDGEFKYRLSEPAVKLTEKAKILQYYNIKRFKAGER